MDRFCYSAAIAACSRTRPTPQWAKALELFEQMKSEEVKPNLILYNTLLRTCVVAQQSGPARAVIDEMVNAGYTPPAELTRGLDLAPKS